MLISYYFGIEEHMIVKKENIIVITITTLSFGCNITKKDFGSQVIENGNSSSEIKIIVNSSSDKSLKIVGDENIAPLIKKKIVKGILKIRQIHPSMLRQSSNNKCINLNKLYF